MLVFKDSSYIKAIHFENKKNPKTKQKKKKRDEIKPSWSNSSVLYMLINKYLKKEIVWE